MTGAFRYWRVLALGWTLGIVAACTIPGSSLPSSDLWEADKLIHFGLFVGFGALWMLGLTGPVQRRALWVIVTGLAFAGGTEVYQGWLPFGRSPDVFDALANSVGLVVSVSLVGWWLHRHTFLEAASQQEDD